MLREITSYWFDVQNFKQLRCATCIFPHSYLTYVQFAAGIILIISCLVSIVKYNNNSNNNKTNNNNNNNNNKTYVSPNFPVLIRILSKNKLL